MENYLKLRSISEARIAEVSHFKNYRCFYPSIVPTKGIVVIVSGLRGAGKTTAILQKLTQSKASKLYISADSVIFDGTLFEVASDFSQRGGGILAFDEIHKYPNWETEIKSIIDSYPDIKLLVSGSSSMQIDNRSADLSRRHFKVPANGLSFREYLNFNYGTEFNVISLDEILQNPSDFIAEIITSLKTINTAVEDAFKNYLRYGFFPTFSEIMNPSIYFDTLKNSIIATIESDISLVRNLSSKSISNIKRLLKIISGLCPYSPNITTLKNQLNIADAETLKTYLQYLHEAEIIKNLYKKNSSPSDLLKPEKIFLGNTNYMFALNTNPNRGNLRETFVMQTLCYKHQVSAPDKGDFEVDEKYFLEVGGKNKTTKQIKSLKNAYILRDDDNYSNKNQIPLWLIGFIY